MIISIIGGGGKTTTLFYLARKYAKENKKVIVTTSTKMLKDNSYTHFYVRKNEDFEEYIDNLDFSKIKDNILFIGKEAGLKISSLSEEQIERLSLKADIVLIEADGSKNLPVKIHKDNEPVIIKKTNKILILCGLDALYKSFEAVCHRYELLSEYFALDYRDIVDEEKIYLLLLRIYNKISDLVDKENIFIILNKLSEENKKSAYFLKEKIEKDLSIKVYLTAHESREIEI